MSKEKKTILIGEDSSVIQNLTKKILSVQNYDIVGIKNGKKVLEAVQNKAVDLLLLDINIPQMDGMEVARNIRKLDDPEKSALPIVAITGNAPNYSEEDFKEAGFNEVMLKPIDFDKLVTMVDQLVNQ